MIVEFYTKRDGTKPVEEFLNTLPNKLANKALRSIKRLRDEGFQLTYPDAEKITPDIWELRTKFATDITRIFYFFYDGEKIVLTNGFLKKTDKIPTEEIERAKRYRDDYCRRQRNG